MTTFRNPHRLTIEETLQREGLTLDTACASGLVLDSSVPACCKEGCEVEPDGQCSHGCPSVLRALGVI